MAKYENIRALAKKQLQAVTESSDRWKAFLRTAAIAYNYSFPNQLLIHEQSPTATAVADIAYWNNNAGRWVKRGAHGIAVFDTRANSSRLRYLFDISDTIPRAEIPEALPWVITDQNWRPVWDKIVADNHADSIQSALLMLSTSCVAQRSAMFTTALGKAIDGSSLQWAKPDEQRQLFLQLITQSCLYMAALRCGVDTARLDLSALESVNQFDTNRIALCLGSACQQAARPLMQQIGSITREIDSVARAEKVRYYGDKQEETNNTKEVNNGVHDGERLPNPGADAERAADAGKYGSLRRNFLRENAPMVFDEMLLEGTLYPHLAEMDNAVHRQIEQTMQTLMQQSTAPNRQTDPMGWTQWMNALQSQAEELAMQQIYSL